MQHLHPTDYYSHLLNADLKSSDTKRIILDPINFEKKLRSELEFVSASREEIDELMCSICNLHHDLLYAEQFERTMKHL